MTIPEKSFFVLLFLAVLMGSSACLSATGNQVSPNGTKEAMSSGIDPASTYKKTCGQCHMPYPPEFLPSGSWEKLLGSTEKHFGGTLEIDQKTKNLIAPYLKENGAESSDSKIPQKIMQSLGSNIPLRLTEVPYILKKHRKISSDVFQKKSIGAFANCNACHLLADNWIFTRKISIPK
jgi:hypothetical protein